MDHGHDATAEFSDIHYRGPAPPTTPARIVLSVLADGSDDPERHDSRAAPAPGGTSDHAPEAAEIDTVPIGGNSGHEAGGADASMSAPSAGHAPSGVEASEPGSNPSQDVGTIRAGIDPADATNPLNAGTRCAPGADPARDEIARDPLSGVYSPGMRARIQREGWQQAGGDAQDGAIAARAEELAAQPLHARIDAIARTLYGDKSVPPIDPSQGAQAARIAALGGEVPRWAQEQVFGIRAEAARIQQATHQRTSPVHQIAANRAPQQARVRAPQRARDEGGMER